MIQKTYDEKTESAFFTKRFFIPLSGTVLVLALVGVVLLSVSEQARDISFPRVVSIGEKTYSLELADTDSERTKGLGGRDSLCVVCGMLFVFEQPGRHAFWMKDMRFPIDIVWLSGETVVFVARDVKPDFVGTIDPAVVADRALELSAGAASAVNMGETVRFSY